MKQRFVQIGFSILCAAWCISAVIFADCLYDALYSCNTHAGAIMGHTKYTLMEFWREHFTKQEKYNDAYDQYGY